MKVFDLFNYHLQEPCVLALGFFDCVHLGHKRVITRAVTLARSFGVKSAVFLFRNNIFELLGIEKKPLFSFEERLCEIEKLNVDLLFYINADEAFLNASPEAFISFLKARLNILGVVCGEDYSFGKEGKGNASDLIKAFSFERSEIVPIYYDGGEKIGSAKIKHLLRDGNVRAASELLGRPYSVTGKVENGRKDGAKIGFPTMNIHIDACLLKFGVYFTLTEIDGKRFRSVTNVGEQPTFGSLSPKIETHLLDFEGDAYGKRISVFFLDRERSIIRFNTIDDLMKTLSEDIRKRREYD